MKIAFFLALIFLISCKESTSEFDSLDPRDQAYIRRISTEQCISEFKNTYKKFKENSAKIFSSNSSFDRADGFQQVFKNANNTRTVDVRVWKRTSDEIYFYISEVGESEDQYFLRIKASENEEMIDDLLVDHCVKPAIFTMSSGSNGPISLTYEYEKPVAPDTKKYKDVYTYNFSYPAYFANLHLSRTVTTFNTDNDQVGEPIVTTSTVTAKTYTFTSDDETNTVYNQSYCEIDYETGTTYRVSKNSVATPVGYKRKACVTTPNGPSGDWDL